MTFYSCRHCAVVHDGDVLRARKFDLDINTKVIHEFTDDWENNGRMIGLIVIKGEKPFCLVCANCKRTTILIL
jgi:hypothetical protein